MRAAAAALLLLTIARPASAQLDGYASMMFVALPDLDPAAGNQHVSEFRARVFAERRLEFGAHLRLHVSGYVDGLLADRTNIAADGTTADASADATHADAATAATTRKER